MSQFRFALVLAAVALGTAAEFARAIYLWVETENAPVERLAKNLEEVIKRTRRTRTRF